MRPSSPEFKHLCGTAGYGIEAQAANCLFWSLARCSIGVAKSRAEWGLSRLCQRWCLARASDTAETVRSPSQRDRNSYLHSSGRRLDRRGPVHLAGRLRQRRDQ